MGAAALLLHLVAKTFFLGLPLGVAWLALRRLMLSRSTNAWVYAGVAIFASSTAAGLAPWALGFQSVAWLFIVFAFLCPPLWLATVIFCGIGRVSGYEPEQVDANPEPAPMATPLPAPDPEPAPEPAPAVVKPRLATLVLEQPILPEPVPAADPVFKTHRSMLRTAREMASARLKSEADDRGVLDVARAMRGNPSTAKRRMRPLLPPPHAMSDLSNLPFLQR